MDIIELIRTNAKNKDFPSLHKLFLDSPDQLEKLVEVATSDLNHPYPEYASWLILHIAKNKAEILKKFQEKIIDRILTSQNQSVLRNLVYSNSLIGLDDYKQGELLEFYLNSINNEDNKVALQVYSLYSLIDIVKKYPELKSEINEILLLKQEPLKPALKVAIRNFRLKTKSI